MQLANLVSFLSMFADAVRTVMGPLHCKILAVVQYFNLFLTAIACELPFLSSARLACWAGLAEPCIPLVGSGIGETTKFLVVRSTHTDMPSTHPSLHLC